MKLTLFLKLRPDSQQRDMLLRTMKQFNYACNYVSQLAFSTHTFNQVRLHHLTYYEIRERFNLPAQVAVRVIAKVANSYKTDKKRLHKFKPLGSIDYDSRILSFKSPECISLTTLEGREEISFYSKTGRPLDLERLCNQYKLVYRNDEFYLITVLNVPEEPAIDPDEWLGVDLGIVNLATDSDGEVYTGKKVEQIRRIFAHRRRNLQRKGTKSAKRKLKKISGKQARFQRDVNHVISKRVVQKAKGTDRGIALENLKGIHERTTVSRKQRARHANWSFGQLRNFILYKAQLAGVPVTFVDPKNTSRTCPICGYVDKRNRPTQSSFRCISCGFSAPADIVAAGNISARAVVNQPKVSDGYLPVSSARDKLTALAVSS